MQKDTSESVETVRHQGHAPTIQPAFSINCACSTGMQHTMPQRLPFVIPPLPLLQSWHDIILQLSAASGPYCVEDENGVLYLVTDRRS